MQLDFEGDLLRYVQQFATIESEKLPPDLHGDEVIEEMRARAEENRRLLKAANRIIDERLVPAFENPHALSDEEAAAYADLADKFFSRTTHLDMGLAYPIHKALLLRARQRADVDGIIRHLYCCGLINLRWNMTLFAEKARDYFSEAVGYMDRYFTLESKETRMLLNRCLGNHYVSISSMRRHSDDYSHFFEAVDRAVIFWNSDEARALDPDFPWESFISNSHQNICSWLDKLRTTLFDDRYLAQRVYDSVQALYGKDSLFMQDNSLYWPNARTAYTISASKYHMGLISAREMTNNMTILFDSTRDDDYSQDGLFRMMHVSCYMLEYMRKVPGIPMARIHAEEKRVCDRVLAYYKNLPPDADRFLVNRALSYFLPSTIARSNFSEGIRLLLRLTTFSHLPTHTHSIMVSKLVEALARYFLKRAPERFVGLRYTQNARQVLQRQEEIIAEISLAGLAHDAGKFLYIQTVSLCSRRLIDVEYDIVREHVGAGVDIIEEFIQYDDCTAHVIQGHHKWYDGIGGYPKAFDNTASPYRFVIDMTSVADSIDAATDGIGRCYTEQLTLAEVIDEIKEQAGTRYSPAVAEALDDPALRVEIDDIIHVQRAKVYESVYNAMEVHDDARGQAAQA